MKRILNSVRKIKPENLRRALLLFFLITILMTNLSIVSAQLLGNNTNSGELIPSPPAENSFFYIQDQSEINAIIDNGAVLGVTSTGQDVSVADITSGGCGDQITSRAGGMLGGGARALSNAISGNSDSIICAAAWFNEGDPRMLAYMLNGGSTGLVDTFTNINAMLLNERPLSGSEYIETQIQALINPNTVFAQSSPDDLYYRGPGYDLLTPMFAFWGWSVNIVYALLIFVIIIVAFGIMFRSSMSGGLAAALQQAIPNIALAMILVPLSYAITGLFIDGITVGVNVTHAFLLGPGSPGRGVYDNRNEEFPYEGNFGGVVPYKFDDRGLHADDMRVSWLYSGQVLVTGEDNLGSGITNLAQGFGLIFGISGFFESLGVGHWFIPIVNLLLGLLLLLTGARIFAKLIVKYLSLLLMPMLAPFIFAGVALPGSGTSIITWYAKQMGSITAAYVVTYLMTLLSIIFSSAYFIGQLPTSGVSTYVPPLTGMESLLVQMAQNANTTGATGFNGVTELMQFVFMLVAFGIYMLIPKTLDNIDEKLGVGALPDFYADIFQSAKDSFNLGRTGVSWGKTALNSDANLLDPSKRLKLRASAMNQFDKLRGMNPGEEGSYQARRRARLQSQMARAEQMRQQALKKGMYGAARAYKQEYDGLKNQLSAVDSSFGGDGNTTEGPNKLQAEIAWGASKGLMVIDGAAIGALKASLKNNGVAALKNGSIKITSDVPVFPVRNAPVGLGRKRIPGATAVTTVPREKVDFINKGPDPISGVPANNYFPNHGIGINLFLLAQPASIPNNPPAVQFMIEKDGEVDDDGKTIKFGLTMYLTSVSLNDFLEALGGGYPYKVSNEIQVELVDVFGRNTRMKSNKLSFAIQPQFMNITGLEENPTYTI